MRRQGHWLSRASWHAVVRPTHPAGRTPRRTTMHAQKRGWRRATMLAPHLRPPHGSSTMGRILFRATHPSVDR
eukprot:8698542-Lingulodinium_polyedra.AAC.1